LKSDKQVALKMGIVKAGEGVTMPSYPAVKWIDPERQDTAGNIYGQWESAAIAQIESHVIPEGYRALVASPAMVGLMKKLALDPKALAVFEQNPTFLIDSTPDLKPLEIEALKLGQQNAIIRSMKGKPLTSIPNNSSKLMILRRRGIQRRRG
jgi:hypothetical protein